MSLKGNASATLVAYVVPMGVSLLTVPAYLNILGAAKYGAFILIWTVLDYFNVLGFGVDRAATRYLSENRHDEALRKEILSTALLVSVATGSVGGLAIYCGGFWLLSFFGVEWHLDTPGILAGSLAAASVPVNLIGYVMLGAIEAVERFRALAVLQLVAMILFQVAPLGVGIALGPDLHLMVIAALAARFLLVGALVIFVLRIYGPPRARINTRWMRSLAYYGGLSAFVISIGALMAALDRLVIGAVRGSVAVAYYGVAYNLVTKALLLPGALSRVMFPRLSASAHVQALSWTRDAIIVIAVVQTPLLIALAFSLQTFLGLWVGNEVGSQAILPAHILLAGVWFQSLSTLAFNFVQARGILEAYAKVLVAEIFCYAALMWIAVTSGGIDAAAGVWTARAIWSFFILTHLGGLTFSCKDLLPGTGIMLSAVVAAALTETGSTLFFVSFGLSLAAVFGWGLVAAPLALREAAAALIVNVTRRR